MGKKEKDEAVNGGQAPSTVTGTRWWEESEVRELQMNIHSLSLELK